MTSTYHIPVLLKQTIDALKLKAGIYIDCTLGGGGHFRQILEEIKSGVVIGIDADIDAINENIARLEELGFVMESQNENIWVFKKGELTAVLAHENFKNLLDTYQKICKVLHRNEKVGGILFDLGVSSYQIDQPSKGFGYMKEGPLDMRMDKRLTVTAADLVNGMYVKELEGILNAFGEEVYARRIAKAIVSERKKGKIETSTRLNEIIRKSVPFFYKNPLAKTYQALRIAVNSEFENLEESLKQLGEILNDNGRVAIISFHSLEDKIVKNYFGQNQSFIEVTGAIEATVEEIDENKRSRSAKLRIFEKTAHVKN